MSKTSKNMGSEGQDAGAGGSTWDFGPEFEEYKKRAPPLGVVSVSSTGVINTKEAQEERRRRRMIDVEKHDLVLVRHDDEDVAMKALEMGGPSAITTGTASKKRKLLGLGDADGDFLTKQQRKKKELPETKVGLKQWSLANFSADGVLGNGKGKLFPKFELGSQYNFVIPEREENMARPWDEDPAVPPALVKPQILSVVASVQLSESLDLKAIAANGINLTYNPSSFTPLTLKMTKPIVAQAMVFKSGKMVTVGTQSVKDTFEAVYRFTARIMAYGFEVKPTNLKIKSITASCNVGFYIRMKALGADKTMSPDTIHDPTTFSGVNINWVYPSCRVMVFRTGSVVITGLKTEEELTLVFDRLYPYLKTFAV